MESEPVFLRYATTVQLPNEADFLLIGSALLF
jgi:hypothetical protein